MNSQSILLNKEAVIIIFAVVKKCPKRGLKFFIKKEETNINGIEFVKLSVPLPKSRRQKQILKESLSPFRGRVVLDKFFKEERELSEYRVNTESFEKRIIVSAFLDYCRENHPKNTAIIGKNFLNDRFFAQLGKYTDKIFLPFEAFDENFSLNMLKLYGVPVVFGCVEEPVFPCLCLDTPKVCLQFVPNFQPEIFGKIRHKGADFLPKELYFLDPLELSAAIDSSNPSNNLFNNWKMLVIKSNMIYNIK